MNNILCNIKALINKIDDFIYFAIITLIIYYRTITTEDIGFKGNTNIINFKKQDKNLYMCCH